MMLYRFSPELYSRDISGEGAKRFGGRWNSKGNAVVYTSLTISLSLLELLMHSASYDEISINHLTTIEVPDTELLEIREPTLKRNWIIDVEFTRFLGDEFLHSGSLLMKVPSAIIAQESNLLINPKHPGFKTVKVRKSERFKFDPRLFKSNH